MLDCTVIKEETATCVTVKGRIDGLSAPDMQKVFDDAKLVEVSDQDYDRVRAMYESVGVNDFSNFLGN